MRERAGKVGKQERGEIGVRQTYVDCVPTSKRNPFFEDRKHIRQGKLNSVKPNTRREKRKDKHAEKSRC